MKLAVLLSLSLLISGCSVGPARSSINSFNDCVRAGYHVMRSMPARCATPDGKVFTDTNSLVDLKDARAQSRLCKDLCGDGSCQEIVCMGEGCPCPENELSCPADCK